MTGRNRSISSAQMSSICGSLRLSAPSFSWWLKPNSGGFHDCEMTTSSNWSYRLLYSQPPGERGESTPPSKECKSSLHSVWANFVWPTKTTQGGGWRDHMGLAQATPSACCWVAFLWVMDHGRRWTRHQNLGSLRKKNRCESRLTGQVAVFTTCVIIVRKQRDALFIKRRNSNMLHCA